MGNTTTQIHETKKKHYKTRNTNMPIIIAKIYRIEELITEYNEKIYVASIELPDQKSAEQLKLGQCEVKNTWER